jgi:hypothetical protein
MLLLLLLWCHANSRQLLLNGHWLLRLRGRLLLLQGWLLCHICSCRHGCVTFSITTCCTHTTLLFNAGSCCMFGGGCWRNCVIASSHSSSSHSTRFHDGISSSCTRLLAAAAMRAVWLLPVLLRPLFCMGCILLTLRVLLWVLQRVLVLRLSELVNQRLEQHSDQVPVPCVEPLQHGTQVCLLLRKQRCQEQVHVLQAL